MPLERLAPSERAALVDAEPASDLYGLLRPRPDGRGEPRAASCDVALLFLTLREPGPLPGFVVGAAAGDGAGVTARLVVDGVLEVLRDGCWVSGPAALPGVEHGEGDVIPALSAAALRYVASLEGLAAGPLAARLYFYGRRPGTPRLRRLAADPARLDAWLGLDRSEVDRHWIEGRGNAHWRHWSSTVAPATDRTRTHLKLYVSPGPEALGDAVVALAAAAVGVRDVHAFKCGRGLDGALRPDKLVAYCHTLEGLHQLASRVRARLDGAPAHGVAFTAGLGAEGLLSWGVDPPPDASGRAGSWRQWMVERLADSIIEGRRAALGHEGAWRFAVDRLALDGVDVRTWVPEDGMFERLASR